MRTEQNIFVEFS
jgi:chromosome segregation ATPase